jgi:hypothetical protein
MGDTVSCLTPHRKREREREREREKESERETMISRKNLKIVVEIWDKTDGTLVKHVEFDWQE